MNQQFNIGGAEPGQQVTAVIAVLQNFVLALNALNENFDNIYGRTYTKLVDSAGAGVFYIGEASPGADKAGAVWRIGKALVVSGITDIQIEWADGDRAFDNIWNNRAALTYS